MDDGSVVMLDYLKPTGTEGERKKAKIWDEAWQEVQEINPEIESLSVDIEELENRRVTTADQVKWTDAELEFAQADALMARQHKRFKMFRDKNWIAQTEERTAALRDRAATLRKEGRTVSDELRQKRGRLERVTSQRESLYGLLRAMR